MIPTKKKISSIKSFLASLPIAFSASASALVPASGDWKTIETDHFKIHYDAKYQDIAYASAHELEVSREKVKQQQNRILEPKVEVLIIDPFNQSNGFAIPFSSKPMTALFATPPTSDTVISNSTGWIQLVALHEYVHLVHIGQPDRGSFDQAIGKVWDLYEIGNLASNMPRWATEGYATLLESRMTGRGRLYDNYVEALIRQFAKEGALPSYQTLAMGDGSYKSGSMAYLMGSRYLRWLEETYSEQQLDQVWTRLRGVKDRTFDQAFAGVFKKSPEQLYERFVAEYTFKAMQEEKNNPPNQTVETWLDVKDWLFSPTLSPEEDLIAVVTSNKRRQNKIVVYSTSENEEAKKDFEEAQQSLIDLDARDIPDVAPDVFPREVKYSLNQRNFSGVRNPRWINQSEIMFGASNRDAKGEMHQDLYRWNIKTGNVTQITDEQNIRRFDVHPDGNFLIAEQTIAGYSQLVKIDLKNNGKVTKFSEKSLESVFDFPRFSPDGKQLAYLKSELNENWKLNIVDLTSNKTTTVPMPKNYQFLSHPEWSKAAGSSIYFVAGVDSALDIFEFNQSKNRLAKVTEGNHPLLSPVSKKDGSLLYLKETSIGTDLVSLNATNGKSVNTRTNDNNFTLDLAGPHALPEAKMIVPADDYKATERNYGIGQQRVTMTLGGSYSSNSYELSEIGIKSSDLIHRFTWQLKYGAGTEIDDVNGFSGLVRWRGWPIETKLEAYQSNMITNKQAGDSIDVDLSQTGTLVTLSYPYQFNSGSIALSTKAHVGTTTIEDTNGNSISEYDFQRYAVSLNQNWLMDRNFLGFSQKLKVTQHQVSQEFKDFSLGGPNNTEQDYTGQDIRLDLGMTLGKLGINVAADQRTRSDGNQISLGGFHSTIFQPNYFEDSITAKELPFFAASSDEYQGLEVSLYSKGSPFRLFYKDYDLKDTPELYSWGIDFNVFSGKQPVTGIEGLVIEAGLVEVNPEFAENSIEGWFGLWYKF